MLASTPCCTTLSAQGLATPVAHWGGYLLPSIEPSVEWSLHFVGFTQYGKEKDTTGKYLFHPYNDIAKTYGYNMLSYARSDILDARVLTGSTLSARTTLFGGVIDDNVPRFLQNQVIHLSNLRGKKLAPVPRRLGDTPDHISDGDHSPWPIVGYSRELFMRMNYSREENGVEERVLAPFFVGGGYAISTLNQELFFHIGSDIKEYPMPWWLKPPGINVRSVGLGGMIRAGVLVPGPIMTDLTSDFMNAQGVVRFVLDVFDYPIRVDYVTTGAHGYFVAPRNAEQRAIIAEFPPETRDASVYQAKSAMSERFSSIRVAVGNLTFETYNDSYGGKDKGPTFGAQISLRVAPPARVTRSASPKTLPAPKTRQRQ
ncbi:MAG: hypothetical protein ABIY52_03220 [Gemmatimonadaceae bacterium]